MPLYDFACPDCGAHFEAQVPYEESAKCPACGAGHTERLLSPFAIGSAVRPRGVAAKRSDDSRRVREEQRAERKAARQAKRDSN
jgi:putative FmdB family regulatory protein